MKNVKLKAKKRIVESDAVEDIDPDLQALFNAVSDLEAKKPGSTEKFLKIAKEKYGVSSIKDLKKGMSLWLKVPAGGLALAGFIASIGIALDAGYRLAIFFKFWGWKAGSWLMGHTTTSWQVPSMGIAAIFASFVFYKIFKYIVSDRSSVSEGTNPALVRKYNNISAQKSILECEMMLQEISALCEGEEAAATQAMNAAEKADGICKRMFSWLKEKYEAGSKFFVEYPFICIPFLIVIGMVAIGLASLAKMGYDVNWGEVYSTMSDKAQALCNEVVKYKDSIDVDQWTSNFANLAKTEKDQVLGYLGRFGDSGVLASISQALGMQ